MNKFLLHFILLFTAVSLKSQTNISAGIFSSTTWPKSGNPYIVTGTVVVFPGATLTIDPGTIIKFNSSAALEIRGVLVAKGNSVDTITFTSNLALPTKGSWGGIKAVGTTNPLGVGNQVTMTYVKGMYADRFIDMDIAYHGPYVFANSYFAHNNKVNHDGGMPSVSFDRCKFEYNTLGLDYCQFGGRASNCEFINNIDGLNGIDIVDSCFFSGNTGIACSPYGKTRYCTITNNNIGVNCYFNAVNNTFINNNVSLNNQGVEIKSYFNGGITFTNNAICNNINYNIRLLTNNNADLSNNCWCTNNSSVIASKIYDGYINTAFGLVNFAPFNSNCSPMGLTNYISSTNHLVYPNPFYQELNIEPFHLGSELVIYDITSREVFHSVLNTNKITVPDLKQGIYLYTIINDNGETGRGRLVKQ